MANYDIRIEDKAVPVTLDKGADGLRADVGGETYYIFPLHGQTVRIVGPDNTSRLAAAVWHKDTCYVDIDGFQIDLQIQTQDSSGFAGADSHGAKDKVFAPMPGKIVKILVEVGDEVHPKQALAIVEAMKMENQVVAKASGKVKAVHFAVGDQVNTETPIVELELHE